MYEYGIDKSKRLANAQFLYNELPTRIAHRVVDLLTLPHGLSEAQPIRQVASIYLKFLHRHLEFPSPRSTQKEEKFTDMLQSFVLDRSTVPVSISQGVKVWMDKQKDTQEATQSDDYYSEMEKALYRFFTARVGLRFLTEHYVLCSERESAKALRKATRMFPVTDAGLGCIQTNIDVVFEIQRVSDLVVNQTKDYYNGLAPVIDIVDCSNKQMEFCHIAHHLHYMFAELLKNSCRASVRQHLKNPSVEIPDIKVIITKGEEDVTIKIADKGGGIARSKLASIWKFAHSTADSKETETDFGKDAGSGAKIRGFGLPLARIYARYFGGELTLKSTEGYGLDAYLHLPMLGTSCERLPLRVRDSPGALVSLPSYDSTLAR